VSGAPARWRAWARLALGLVLLGAIFFVIDPRAIARTLVSAKLGFVALGLVLSASNVLLASWRWWMLLNDRGCLIPFGRLVRIYLVSGFLSNFLPSSMATDGLRIYYAAGYTRDVKLLVSSMVLDRIIGFFAMAVIALLTLAALPFVESLRIAPALSAVMLAFCAVALALPFLAFHPAVVRLVRRILLRWQHVGLVARLDSLYGSFLLYRESPRTLARVTALAFVTTLRGVLLFYVVALAFSSEVPFLYFLLLVPFMSVVESIPISLSGLGVNEGAIVLYFAQLGMATAVSASIALVVRTLSVVSTLPGGLLYLLDRSALRQALAREEAP
jgi:uncharacterized protein (TIRG00374 family)